MSSFNPIRIGDRFGRLVVKQRGVTQKIRRKFRGVWICVCDCGKEHIVKADGLRSGKTKSCGCLHADNVRTVNITHGHARNRETTAELLAWRSMIIRCSDSGYLNFDRYGGRGIKVCEKWQNSFESFLADMGPRPSPKHSLDRIDVDGNYEPENCRWATPKEQARNKSTTVMVEINGKQVPLVELAERAPVSYAALKWRIYRGWDLHLALTRPKRGRVGVLK